MFETIALASLLFVAAYLLAVLVDWYEKASGRSGTGN